MTDLFKPIDLSKITTYPLGDRNSKVSDIDFAKKWVKGSSFEAFLEGLPNILAGSQVMEVVSSILTAYKNRKTVMFAMGAHVIKVGLNPVVIDLMERGVITSIAMNGAGIIHDFEIALTGRTSEDVAASLEDGTFGMAHETCSFLGDAIVKADREASGLGAAVGASIIEQNLPFSDNSILAAGARLGIPVTIHIAIGTDIIHMHPEFDPAKAGAASHRDFRLFASVVASLEEGVYLNVGSAVILPEVFLKAITIVRNLGHNLKNITTVNIDFIQHYRPTTNVVNRPTAAGGRGYKLTGHHEILVPLIAAGIIEKLD
ncbi:MAG: hypothetical protein J7K30_10705 [Deltaproteobacteria bacterium]|nr:hypothetical protein [Deltaproteobacteria bacterium]